VNPLTGLTRKTANIGGHRDYQATSCPGGVLYGLLPAVRREVAAQMNTWPGMVYNPPRVLTFAAGTYVGRKFTAAGSTIGSKTYTLPRPSTAPTTQKSVIPTQYGGWYFVSAGVWAGYWIRETSGITVSRSRTPPVLEAYATARPLTIPAGTYVGRNFSTWGDVRSSRTSTVSSVTVVWTTQRSTIPKQTGHWYYVTVGAWEGYWILDTAGMTLGDPPPPLPEPIAIYKPPRTLWLAPGTYTGRLFSAYGVPAGSHTATLTKTSSAPTSRYSTLPGQTGNWYYIVAGVWDTYWIKESAGTTLAPP